MQVMGRTGPSALWETAYKKHVLPAPLAKGQRILGLLSPSPATGVRF